MGSKLFPNTFNGKIQSGGYLAKNQYKGNNAKAPPYKGRVYVQGAGWFWAAGWIKQGTNNSFISLSLTDMTDEEAQKYCIRQPTTGASAPRHREPGEDDDENGNFL